MKTDDTIYSNALDIKVQTIKTRKTKFYKLWIVGNLQWRGMHGYGEVCSSCLKF